MKRFSAFVFSLLSFGNVVDTSAQTRNGRGEIAVRSEDGERLGIEVDGRRYEQFSSRLLLGDIPPGKKSVIIYRLRPGNSNGMATAQTVYEGRMLVREGYRIVLTVNPKSGDVNIDQQVIGPVSANEPAEEMPVSKPKSAPPVSAKPAPPSVAPAPKSVPPASPAAVPSRPAVVAQGDWRKLVESKNTDTERMRILKARVTGHAITTQELIPMMKALSFEYSKLDLAKAALPNLTDRQNLNAVSVALEDASSRKELEAAIRQLPR